MHLLSTLRRFSYSTLFFMFASLVSIYVTFHNVTSETNKFFYVIGGSTSVIFGFAIMLNGLNYLMLSRDIFYSKWSWFNYIISTSMLISIILMPSEVIINFMIVFVASIFNIFLFFSILHYRTLNSVDINKLHKLFPDEKVFKFDTDFDFNNDFLVEYEKKSKLSNFEKAIMSKYGICLIMPFSDVVYSSGCFYFNDLSFDEEHLIKAFNNANVRFGTATADEVKLVEMVDY